MPLLANMSLQLLSDLLPKADSQGVVPWLAPVVAVGAVAFVYIRSRQLARRKKDPLAKPPMATSLAQHRSVERQMQSLLVELSEMARQIGAQLDTRAGKLDVLLREADQKLTQLQVASETLAATRAHVTEARLAVAAQLAAAPPPPEPAARIDELPAPALSIANEPEPQITLTATPAEQSPAPEPEPEQSETIATASAPEPPAPEPEPVIAEPVAAEPIVTAPSPAPTHVTAFPVRSAAASSARHASHDPVIIGGQIASHDPPIAPPEKGASLAESPEDRPTKQNGTLRLTVTDSPPAASASPEPFSAVDAGLANVAALPPEAFHAFDQPEEAAPRPAAVEPERPKPIPFRSAPVTPAPTPFAKTGLGTPKSAGFDGNGVAGPVADPFTAPGNRPIKWPKAARPAPEPAPTMTMPRAAQRAVSDLLLSTSAPIPPDPRHVTVYQLADQGLSINAIAQQLDRPHGEIELILALRPRQERLV